MQFKPCIVYGAFLPYAGKHILQLPALGGMVMHVVGCQERHSKAFRNIFEPVQVFGIIAQVLPGSCYVKMMFKFF